jgi:hypothetical protein
MTIRAFAGGIMKRIVFQSALFLLTVAGTAAAQSNYFQFGALNNAAVNLTSSWSRLNTTSTSHTFTKADGATDIEVHVNSRFKVGSFSNHANGVRFQVRIDDKILPTVDNMGSLLSGNSSDFLSIYAVFRRLPAGIHRVSIWGSTALGNAASVVVDPGGWSGKIIVKETK